MPEWVSYLPAVNATLNAIATVLLIAGFLFVKSRHLHLHRASMLSAFVVSIVFLGCYLLYHAYAGSKRFPDVTGWRETYLVILVTHVVLAAAVPVLAGLTLWRAFRGQLEAHRRIARITFPIWLYVSVTGVVIYVMLYQIGPQLLVDQV